MLFRSADDAKETLEAVGKKIGREFEDAKDRIGDKVDENRADANVKKAEAERDSTTAKNDAKEKLRDDK